MKTVKDFKERIKQNRSTIILCFAATFILGLMAHSYRFFSNSVSHDSIIRVISRDYAYNVSMTLGRIFYLPYQLIVRGFISAPWLIGVLSLVFIALAVFLTVKLFNIKKPSLIILLSGVLAVNVTVISTAATYIEDLDGNMFAMLMATLSVYLWRNYKKGFLLGALPLSFAMGIYQSFISVAIVLIMLLLIMDLLKGKKAKEVLLEGLKGIAMLIIAGVLYYIALKIITAVLNIELTSDEYNSLGTFLSLSFKEMALSIVNTWTSSISYILFPVSAFSLKTVAVLHGVMFGIAGIMFVLRVFSRALGIWEKLIALCLTALLPLGMNICRVLANNMSHDLMHYSLWFGYLMVIIVTEWNTEENEKCGEKRRKAVQVISGIMIAVTVFGNIRLANQAYFVKDCEQDATMALFTRVTARMEDCEGYIPGETPVCVIGDPAVVMSSPFEYYHLRKLTGMYSESAVTYGLTYRKYYEYVLMMPINIVFGNPIEQSETVQNMPTYPALGSIGMVDGVMVVKFS